MLIGEKHTLAYRDGYDLSIMSTDQSQRVVLTVLGILSFLHNTELTSLHYFPRAPRQARCSINAQKNFFQQNCGRFSQLNQIT